MRWSNSRVDASESVLPGLARAGLTRSVTTPDFAGMTFHEVTARSALNHVPDSSRMLPGEWTINPYRGCGHACVYCYARTSHRYLDLDTGADFDSQIVVKANIVEILRQELRSRRTPPSRVALGTSTDPYQRAEGKYRLMPGIIRALSDYRVPFSILSKGTLIRRDLAQLYIATQTSPVQLGVSIAIPDEELQHSLEPGTPSTTARLETVSAIRELGLDCTVFVAPIIPFLTDGDDQLLRLFGAVAAAGATGVLFTSLSLGYGFRSWFMQWLARERPELVAPYARLYRGGANAEPGYLADLDSRVRAVMTSLGLETGTAVAERFALLGSRTPETGPTLF